MNKLGLLAGIILLPFTFLSGVPMGQSYLPLHLIEVSGTRFGIFGTWQAADTGILTGTWWFLQSNPQLVLMGFIFWMFPLVSAVLAIAGARKSPDEGKRYYYSASFLMCIMLGFLAMDAVFLGQLFLQSVLGLAGLIDSMGVGLGIVLIDTACLIAAAITYKEI